jgi:hypothetical protein
MISIRQHHPINCCKRLTTVAGIRAIDARGVVFDLETDLLDRGHYCFDSEPIKKTELCL